MYIYIANLRKVFSFSDVKKAKNVIILGCFQYYLSITDFLRL